MSEQISQADMVSASEILAIVAEIQRRVGVRVQELRAESIAKRMKDD